MRIRPWFQNIVGVDTEALGHRLQESLLALFPGLLTLLREFLAQSANHVTLRRELRVLQLSLPARLYGHIRLDRLRLPA